MADDRINLHEAYESPGALGFEGTTTFRRQLRTTTTKKHGTRVKAGNYRVDWEAEPLVYSSNAKELNAQIANTIAETVRAQIAAVRERAQPGTLARRERHRRSPNTRWAKRRYTGGKTGDTMPHDVDLGYLLNDSGRLRDNIRVGLRRRKESSASVATMNVPNNRLDPTTAGNMSPIIRALQKHVPLLAGKGTGDAEIQRALKKAMDAAMELAIATSEAEIRRKQALLKRMVRRTLKTALSAAGIRVPLL